MGRYRREVRADLLEVYGVDLHEIVRARRVRYALDLIDGLPSASRLRQAMLDDREVAEQIIAEQDRSEADGHVPEEWRLQVSENTPTVIMLTRILQAIDELTGLNVTQVTQGKKKHKPRRLPTPKTAVDTVRDEKTRENAREIQRIFLPHENP